MNRMKMIAKNPAAPTAAFVKAPEIDVATVRAANEMPMTRSTRAASGELILDVTPNLFSPASSDGLMIHSESISYIIFGMGNLWIGKLYKQLQYRKYSDYSWIINLVAV